MHPSGMRDPADIYDILIHGFMVYIAWYPSLARQRAETETTTNSTAAPTDTATGYE